MGGKGGVISEDDFFFLSLRTLAGRIRPTSSDNNLYMKPVQCVNGNRVFPRAQESSVLHQPRRRDSTSAGARIYIYTRAITVSSTYAL